jgi:hypothetical protein
MHGYHALLRLAMHCRTLHSLAWNDGTFAVVAKIKGISS